MTVFRTLAIAAGALALAAGPALAVTVANGGDSPKKVVVDLGEQETEHAIEAGATAKLACPEGCELRIVGLGYGWAATAGDTLSIGKDGLMSYGPAKEARNETDGKVGPKTAVD